MNFNKTVIATSILFIVSISLCEAQRTTFEFDKMNVAFIGLPNQITVKVENEGNDKFIPTISSENGSFEFVDSLSNYSLTEYKFNGEFHKTGSHIIVIENENDTLLTYEMRCKNIPDPQFMIDLKYMSGEIDKKKIKKAIGAGTTLRNFDFYYQFNLKRYRCTIIKDGEINSTFQSSEFRFSEEMKSVLNSLSKNDIIIFDQIIAQGDNGEEREIQSVNYRIK